jgi:hypothetical protein
VLFSHDSSKNQAVSEPPRPDDFAAWRALLNTLFLPADVVLIRFIETWFEGGKKKERLVSTYHTTAGSLADGTYYSGCLAEAEGQRANIFFGVCPRQQAGGAFDRACQIPLARCLWADLDHTFPEEALLRCEKAGLPVPSIVVSTGNGVHLYWLLAEAYIIDDCFRLPIYSEKVDGKRVFFYLTPDNQRCYQIPDITPKAAYLQSILAGMKNSFGGDHTQDVSRLLRLPGTLNRKDQRNGAQPKPCTLVKCDANCRYSLDCFTRFAMPVHKLERGSMSVVAAVQKDAGELAPFIRASAEAPVGERSDKDFALCKESIKRGWTPEEVWELVKDVGKFAERGWHYFYNDTWEAARKDFQKPYQPDDPFLIEMTKHAEETATRKGASGKTILKHPTIKKQKAPSQASRLISLAPNAGEFFVTPEGVSYALVVDGTKREAVKLSSPAFKRWLVSLAGSHGMIPNNKALQEATNVLDALAHNNKTPRRVYYRLARVGDTIYLDLANQGGEVVEVSAAGWKVTTSSPVAFIRHGNMSALPVPIQGGDLSELRDFINVDDDGFLLMRGWLLDCYKGDGPYTVLLINGEQGSAKSTATKLLRTLIDPVEKALVSRLQRDEWDLAISAENNMVLAFDNVSTLPQWLSDALAALATGSGLRIRTHYQMNEETVFGRAIPIVFNGIPDFAESADLLDRSIKVTLPTISPEQRKDEDSILPGFRAATPRLLGAILDAVSAGLRHYPHTKLTKLPRMARSARWVTACETEMSGEKFLGAYARSAEELNALAVDNSTVATVLLGWLANIGVKTWKGTASELYDCLTKLMPGLHQQALSNFPKNAARMASELRRIATPLRRTGVLVSFGASNGKRYVSIEDGRVTPDGACV